jgi:hypothetical protein
MGGPTGVRYVACLLLAWHGWRLGRQSHGQSKRKQKGVRSATGLAREYLGRVRRGAALATWAAAAYPWREVRDGMPIGRDQKQILQVPVASSVSRSFRCDSS